MKSRILGVVAILALAGPTVTQALTLTTCGSICFTSSTATVDTTVNTSVVNQVNTYSTEIVGLLQGGGTVFDQTLAVGAGDASFLTAVGAAELALAGAGATSFCGPTLANSTDTLGSNSVVAQTNQTTSVVAGSGTWVGGPLTLTVGDWGVCQNYAIQNGSGPSLPSGLQSASNYAAVSGCSSGTASSFTVSAGQTIYDTFALVLVETDTTTTTTNTDLLTQVYDVVGIVPTTTSVPEPATLSLLGLGLAGIGLMRRRKPA